MKQRILWGSLVLLLVGGVGYFYNRTSTDTEIEDLWGQHWDEIDLAAIQRDYQPFTVAEMCDMWHDELIIKYGGSERLNQSIGKAVDVYPQNIFLARMLELGRPFVDFSDYEDALTNQRIMLSSTRAYWESLSAAERVIYLAQRGFIPDATWEHYEEVLLKNEVVHSINFLLSIERDPYMNGTLSSSFDYFPR